MSNVEQSRKLITPIPGPLSTDLAKRRSAAISRGVGSTLPVFAARAAGGIIEDVDGNRFIDLGSGIAVTTIGNAAPRVVEAVRAQPYGKVGTGAAHVDHGAEAHGGRAGDGDVDGLAAHVGGGGPWVDLLQHGHSFRCPSDVPKGPKNKTKLPSGMQESPPARQPIHLRTLELFFATGSKAPYRKQSRCAPKGRSHFRGFTGPINR